MRSGRLADTPEQRAYKATARAFRGFARRHPYGYSPWIDAQHEGYYRRICELADAIRAQGRPVPEGREVI